MADRFSFLLMGFLLSMILFTGCTSPKSIDNLTNPEHITLNTTTSTSGPSESNQYSVASKNEGLYIFTQNETAYQQIDSNTSFALSLGDISIQQDSKSGTEHSYEIDINMTSKNTGSVPIFIAFATVYLKDNSGVSLCQSGTNFTCGVIFLDVKPGESNTKTLKIPLYSIKGYDNLTSQKYILEGIIDAGSDRYGGGYRKWWSIDLRKSTKTPDISGSTQ